jgi:hypothetical protein
MEINLLFYFIFLNIKLHRLTGTQHLIKDFFLFLMKN